MRSYITYSAGYNGFQSAQSLYYAKEVGKMRKIIVTGYLGSEVLANPKGPDEECTPRTVIEFLTLEDQKRNVAYELMGFLNELGIETDVEKVNRIISKLGYYFSGLPKHLSKNQKFSVYAFETVYRDTFGVWIYNAMHYAKIRVPFMDRTFLESISKTEVSQFYREFLENRPFKRIKGQLLYPSIMQKTWPEINALTSSKGYAPAQLLTLRGKLSIFYKKFRKKNPFAEKNGLNKLGTISGALKYISKLEQKDDNQEINFQLIKDKINTNTLNRSLCFLALTKVEFETLIKLKTN